MTRLGKDCAALHVGLENLGQVLGENYEVEDASDHYSTSPLVRSQRGGTPRQGSFSLIDFSFSETPLTSGSLLSLSGLEKMRSTRIPKCLTSRSFKPRVKLPETIQIGHSGPRWWRISSRTASPVSGPP